MAKIENEAGYPCYIDQKGEQHNDHPQFRQIIESLEEFNRIKYAMYRIAYKIVALQKHFRVPPLRISSGVLARHQLSLSESSLSLDTVELEAVLADIYFAAEKEGLFDGDIDLTVDLLINLILNVYDKERKEPVRVLSAKTLLIILSEESVTEKWMALAQCCADHNGCVSSKRLTALLSSVAALPHYLGDSCDHVQEDVDACFAEIAGMLGADARRVAAWGAAQCAGARWLSAACRLAAPAPLARCVRCTPSRTQPRTQPRTQSRTHGLQFKCSNCRDVYFCDTCYLYDSDLTTVSGHKNHHVVHEVIDGQVKPLECFGFIRGMRRLFFCTKTKKKTNSKKCIVEKDRDSRSVRKKKDGKSGMVTSTVGKASGKGVNNPTNTLQDIITQLETQNRALKELSHQFERNDDELKLKVDTHWNQISMQINRLKILKENMTIIPSKEEKSSEKHEFKAFNMFSPIAVDEKQTKLDSNTQRRVLSLDSGNYSVGSKQTDNQNLLTMSGDALKPVVHTTTDSVSTVSMNDITSWYVDTNTNERSDEGKPDMTSQSLAVTEQRFAADIRSVEASNDNMKELNADLDLVLDRLQTLLTNNFAMDDSCFDNTQLRETANEMEGLLGTLIRGVEQRATLTGKGLV